MNYRCSKQLTLACRRRWGRIALLSTSLGTAIAILTLHFLTPTVPGRAESLPARIAWYLTHDQWRADSRSFAAAWSYWMQGESPIPASTEVTSLPIAVTPTDGLPRS